MTILLNLIEKEQISFNSEEKNHLLLIAIQHYHLGALEKLLEKNQDLSQLKLDIETIYYSSKELLKALVEKGTTLSPLQEYCFKAKDSELINLLLKIYIYSAIFLNIIMGIEKKNGVYFEESSMRFIPVHT